MSQPLIRDGHPQVMAKKDEPSSVIKTSLFLILTFSTLCTLLSSQLKDTMMNKHLQAVLLILLLACKMRMRLCVASNNPYRLQNQCVYCHNKKFQQTVRTCSGTPYLPANVSLEEGYCMVRQCRSQMPLMRPEPFYSGPDLGDSIGVNVDALSSNDELSYARPPGHHPPPPSDSYGFNSLNSPYPTKPAMRPPAPIFVGRPMRPVRPLMFGKRSLDSNSRLISKLPTGGDVLTLVIKAHN